jgi:putative flavoprotein involved in K+ transport
MERTRTGVLVIGAGQSGLAAGFHLKQANIPHVIVDASLRVGDSWRSRYDSLTLFTPRAFSQLPGVSLRGDPDGYPTRDEFADHIEAFAAANALPVRLGMRVVGLAKHMGFEATFANGSAITADQVIVATGAFQQPIVPLVAKGFAESVMQLPASTYRNAAQLADGPVLVVGDGASGRDIAAELATTHPVLLATGKPRKLVPERVLGRSIWWWLDRLRLLEVSGQSVIGRLMRARDPFPDRDRSMAALKRRGVAWKPRLVAGAGNMATFADESRSEVNSVIWAVGYRDCTEWLAIPAAITPNGAFAHVEGVSPVQGLFFTGRPWQRNRASSLVLGASADAAIIVNAIVRMRMPVLPIKQHAA